MAQKMRKPTVKKSRSNLVVYNNIYIGLFKNKIFEKMNKLSIG